MSNINLLNLVQQHEGLEIELIRAFQEVLKSGNFVSGKRVKIFEESFSKFTGSHHSIACSSGSSALRMILKAAGVLPGDRVVVPAMTFAATIQAVIDVQATPVLVDVDLDSYNISLESLSEVISEDIKAVLVVDFHGRCAEYSAINDLVEDFNPLLIEDAAQAHGAEKDGIKAGNFGIASAFSFYPGKNLGALGEAGAVTTNSYVIAERIVKLRNWGSNQKYLHEIQGSNERMDELQAAFLEIKLKKIEAWTEARRRAAALYDAKLDELGICRPKNDSGTHVYHIYGIRVKNRDIVMKEMHTRGIYVGCHYPIPLHEQPAYSVYHNKKINLANAEILGRELLSLPLWEGITLYEIEHVVKNLREVLRLTNDL